MLFQLEAQTCSHCMLIIYNYKAQLSFLHFLVGYNSLPGIDSHGLVKLNYPFKLLVVSTMSKFMDLELHAT